MHVAAAGQPVVLMISPTPKLCPTPNILQQVSYRTRHQHSIDVSQIQFQNLASIPDDRPSNRTTVIRIRFQQDAQYSRPRPIIPHTPPPFAANAILRFLTRMRSVYAISAIQDLVNNYIDHRRCGIVHQSDWSDARHGQGKSIQYHCGNKKYIRPRISS